MRPILTLLAILVLGTGAKAGNGTWETLCRLNSGWKAQTDIRPGSLPAFRSRTDAGWIALHLRYVESALRRRPTGHLTAAQCAARLQSLDALHRYRLARRFPHNEQVPGRRPVFIDRYDNFCAVGYLIKASGHEDLSRCIAASTNLAYVMDMHHPALDAWAAENGFSKEELAWIQPAYGYAYQARPVGKGTDGVVHELTASPDGERLYVGGSFHTVDDNISAHNIAYLTKTGDSTYTWHSMGSGTNGIVRAIAVHHDTVFIAGRFDSAGGQPVHNVAYWAAGGWHDANCTYGSISDLISFNDNLYAVGDFDICAALSEVNFARWRAGGWMQHPGLEGHVNTIEAAGSLLLLGGNFTYLGQPANAIRYNPASMTFLPFSTPPKNEVLDFCVFRDSMYAGCLRTATDDSGLLVVLRNGDWAKAGRQPGNGLASLVNPAALHTLCDVNNELFIGGRFVYSGIMPPGPIVNCANLYPLSMMFADESFVTDSSIYKFAMFKGKLLLGGAFGGQNRQGIAQRIRVTPAASVPRLTQSTGIRIYPNPVSGMDVLHLESSAVLRKLRLFDAAGKQVFSADLNGKTADLHLPALPAGVYSLECTGPQGNREVQPLQIR